MAVEKIEQFRQKDGKDILKVSLSYNPCNDYFNYFFVDESKRDLVENYEWFSGALGQPMAVDSNRKVRLINEVLPKSNGVVMLISGAYTDFTMDNLFRTSDDVCESNNIRRGYFLYKDKSFGASISYKGKIEYPEKEKSFVSEDEACVMQRYLEEHQLRDLMNDNYYLFDILKYRRKFEQFVNLERTGQISEEEATRRVVRSFEDNAWYYLRYNLEEYFKDNHIPVPKYSLDSNGFMVDTLTGKKLCPF